MQIGLYIVCFVDVSSCFYVQWRLNFFGKVLSKKKLAYVPDETKLMYLAR